MKLYLLFSLLMFSQLSFGYSRWATRSDITAMCKDAVQFGSEIAQCVRKFRNVRISQVAITTCKKSEAFPTNVDECVMKMANYRLSPLALRVCQEAEAFDSNLDECVMRLENLDISRTDIDLCHETTNFPSNLDECIKDTSRPYYDDQNGGDLQEIRAKVQRALNLLQRNNTYAAKNLLQELLDSLDNNMLF